MTLPILAFNEFTFEFETKPPTAPVVRRLTLSIGPGETLAVVGESGSGKSTMAYNAMRDLGVTGRLINGNIEVSGIDLVDLTPGELRKLRGGQVAMVPQDPMTSLSPSVRVGRQLEEVLFFHNSLKQGPAMDKAVRAALQMVELLETERILRSYPHELSGGQQQRVLIALAMISKPDLLILDEPTTGLDVTTEARILELIGLIQKEYGTAVLLITHNLGIVRQFSQRVIVLYAGDIVESGPVKEILENPSHPYTKGLLHCIPQIDSHLIEMDLPTIAGGLPDRNAMPSGCLFAPRCPLVSDQCHAGIPELKQVAEAHQVRCIFAEEQRVSNQRLSSVSSTPVPVAADAVEDDVLLAVEGLAVRYETELGVVHAVDGVDFQCRRGEVLGIVGESGCGKSSLARSIAGLLVPSSGRVIFDQQDITRDGLRRPAEVRRRIQMVFQNPEHSLNPQHTIEKCLLRPIKLFSQIAPENYRDRIIELLESVKLNSYHLNRYPHELSGGERQRVAIARALAAEPDLVICDEPVSSLDVSVQAGILNLLQESQRTDRVAFIFISHDLNVVRHISNRIVVMYRGRICETGTTAEVLSPPYHPYSEALLGATPIVQSGILKRKVDLPFTTSKAAGGESEGCLFADRCPHKVGLICESELPPDRSKQTSRRLFCHLSTNKLGAMEPIFTRTP